MKEKRKIIILDRVIRRFKKMCGAFIILSGLQYFLSYTLKSVKDLQIEEIELLIDKIEDDDDVQSVFTNIA